jgi:hypothetical protein
MIAIRVDLVSHVLLSDGWHKVRAGSFDLGFYTYQGHTSDTLVTVPTRTYRRDVFADRTTAATWQEAKGITVACPFSSVLAVKMRQSRQGKG